MDPPGLSGEHVVVLGGAGQLGRFLVQDLLRHSARVVVPTRRPWAVTELADEVVDEDSLIPVITDIATDGGAEFFGRYLDEHDIVPVAAVASLGGWWEGEHLLDLPLATWEAFLSSHLTTHFLAARTVVPRLGGRPDPCYLTLNGIATHQPCIGSGPVCVTGAGQTMLLAMLEAENTRPGLRFHELSVLAPVHTDLDRQAEGEEIEPESVAGVVREILSPGYPAGDTRPQYP